jgi:glycosyltransferase involved in cell wall biosynthesis
MILHGKYARWAPVFRVKCNFGAILMMHVCMVAREFPPESGGIGYYVYNLSRKLIERGNEVTVLTRGSATKTTREIVDEIEVFKVPFFPIYPLHMWIHGVFVNSLLKSFESSSSLVHLHTPLSPPIRTSLPMITTVHTCMKFDSRYHEVLDPLSLAEKIQSMVVSPHIESKVFKISTSVTAVSLSVANELKQYGLDSDRITVVGNGVDEKLFSPVQDRNCVDEYVLYTGVLRGRKGLFDLLECARRVCQARPITKFLICGTGPFLFRLEERVRRMGLQRQIIFLGHVTREKLVEVYQNATLHVIPSHYEGLPTVLLEAMSCAIPVVATDVGGNSDVISSGVNGFLIPPKSPEKLAEAVLALLCDVNLRQRVGRAARKTIEELYTWDRITDKILKCYESIL